MKAIYENIMLFLYNLYSALFGQYYCFNNAITFRKDWDGKISKKLSWLLDTVSIIYFEGNICKNIFTEENQKYFRKIRTIHLPDSFNEEILFYPQNLQVVIYGSKYNSKIDALPDSVRTIVFGHFFNLDIDKLPKNIIEIKFGELFNSNINISGKLKKIEFGKYFNQDISQLSFTAEELIFGDEFNQNINFLLPGVKIIRFGFNFNQNIDLLPEGLEELTVNSDVELGNLPRSLKVLKIGGNFKERLQNLPDIEELIFSWDSSLYSTYSKKLENLPDSIRVIQVPRWYTDTFFELPKNIEKILFYTDSDTTSNIRLDIDLEKYEKLKEVMISSDHKYINELKEKYGDIIIEVESENDRRKRIEREIEVQKIMEQDRLEDERYDLSLGVDIL